MSRNEKGSKKKPSYKKQPGKVPEDTSYNCGDDSVMLPPLRIYLSDYFDDEEEYNLPYES